MKYIIPLLFLGIISFEAIAQDSLEVYQLDSVHISDESGHNMGHLRHVDGMKLTVGKKSEVIEVEQLNVNKATNNTRQVYAKVTGLNIFENDGSGLQLSIGGRGLDPNRTANFNVRQNGYDISADALGYPESYYTPPSDALSRIEIIKGAASLQFGTQFGGLLNFKMKQPGGNRKIEADLRQTIGSWGFLGSFNSINGTIGKFSYYAYAHYKQGKGWRANSDFSSLNVYADVHYQAHEDHSFGLELTSLHYLSQQAGGLDDRMFAQDARQSNRSRNWFAVKWNLLNLHWDAQLAEGVKLQTQLYGLMASRDALGFRTNRPSQPDLGGPRDLLRGDFKTLGLESRLLKKYMLWDQYQNLLVGFRFYKGDNKSIQGNVVNDQNDFEFRNEEEIMNEYTLPNLNVSFFAEHSFAINKRLKITPGIRYEWIQTEADGMYREVIRDLRDSIISDKQINEKRILPRSLMLMGIGFNYNVAATSDVYGNLSQNYRSVTFSDIRTANPAFEIDPGIKDEKGWSADLGIRGGFRDILQYDISGFYLYYGNRIGEYFFAKPNGQVIRKRGNVGVAQVYGLETFLELNVWRLFFQGKQDDFELKVYSNLALTQAYYTKSVIPNIKGSRVEYVPFLNWKSGIESGYKQLRLTWQISHLSRQYADATNAVDGGYSGVNGIIPSYLVMDLSLKWVHGRYSVASSVNNIANSYYFTRRATGYPGPGIIPGDGRSFYLTLGLKL